MKYLGIDIGGTWIKGASVEQGFFENNKAWQGLHIERVVSPLSAKTKPKELIRALEELILTLKIKETDLIGIGISTTGIVDYHGTHVKRAAPHLNILKDKNWKNSLEIRFECAVTLINDADAAAIGLAELGYLKEDRVFGVMPIGTGVGFSIWKNGRRWRPGKELPLVGSIILEECNVDTLISASTLFLQSISWNQDEDDLNNYMHKLANVIYSASTIYGLDEVIICGGLANALQQINFPLEQRLNELNLFRELSKPIRVILAEEGNLLQQIGSLSIAHGEYIAQRKISKSKISTQITEQPFKPQLRLEAMQTRDLVDLFWKAEQKAGEGLGRSIEIISKVIDSAVDRIVTGGRLIYVGAGTSGRIAAMDAVEIPCTYGFPESKVIALISGGIADAAIEIEGDYEEDASAVPEMLLLNICPNDVVIGISAGGSANYVLSALAFAKSRKAQTVIIQVEDKSKPDYCDYIIPLFSGNEVVAGSTRMKAGTSTKKVLNFISSTLMIRMGKVVGPYMTNMTITNQKLELRAQRILKLIFDLDKDVAMKLLRDADMKLGTVVKKITSANNKY